ncbi:MAG: 1,2-diacylglycerol 3-alpha-glucosyltransferase [Candidatus Methanomethylophilaceae archaeon]|nr:1,2-diacylglycerol 3-alpha-glucosyltransferase [Candidatus Methanomethylophilaceae archaeon]
MRIAMPTDSYLPTRDGVVTSVISAKQSLEALGHEVIVVAPDPGEGAREDGTIYFPSRSFRSYPGYFVPIYPSNKIETIRELNVDIIHSQGQLTMAVRSMLASRELKLPVVISFHTMVTEAMQYYSPIPLNIEIAEKLFWIYFRYLLNHADAVIAPTEAIKKELLSRAPAIKRIEVIPTGIDTKRFNPSLDGTIIRERYSLDGYRVVLHVGRISFEKNIGTVIRALKYLPEDVILLLVGTGPAMENMKMLAEELGISDRVVFTGFVPDTEIPLYYAAADTLVIASKFETQGLVVLEAMGCGTPVAAIGYRALKDTIENGVNGYLFEDDPLSCARAVTACLEADGEMKRAARRTAERYSMETSAERMVSLYEDAIEIKRRRLKGRN